MKTTDEIMGVVEAYVLARCRFHDMSQSFNRQMGDDVKSTGDALRAALTAHMGWHPMDSAPKDGEPVLVYKGDERRVGAYMTAAYWGEWPDCEDCWIAVGGRPLGYFSKLAGAPQGYPSHWMPLPPPPAEGSPT